MEKSRKKEEEGFVASLSCSFDEVANSEEEREEETRNTGFQVFLSSIFASIGGVLGASFDNKYNLVMDMGAKAVLPENRGDQRSWSSSVSWGVFFFSCFQCTETSLTGLLSFLFFCFEIKYI